MFTLAIWGILTVTQTGLTLLAWSIYPHYRMVATTFYATFLLQMALLFYTIDHSTTSLFHLAPVCGAIGIALIRFIYVAFTPNNHSLDIHRWMLQWLLFTTLVMPYLFAQPNIVYPSNHAPIQWPWLLTVCLAGMGVGIAIPALYNRLVTMGEPKSRGTSCFTITLKPLAPRWMTRMYQQCRAIHIVFPNQWPNPIRACVRRWSSWQYSRSLLHRNAVPTDAQSYDDWSGWVWNVGWAESVSTGIHALGYPSSWENLPSLLHGVSVLYGPNQWGGCGLWSQQDSTLPSAEWAMMRTLVAHAGIHDGDTILECGNGLGGFTCYLAQRFPNATIISLVPTQYHADFVGQHAQVSAYSNVKVQVAGDTLPLASIDRIIMGAMGGYGASYQAWWADLRRCLRPHGVLVGYQPTHSHHSVRIAQTQNGVSDWIQSWIPQGYIPDLQSMIMAQTPFRLDEHWEIPSEMMAKTFGAWRMNLNRVGINNLVQLTGLHHGIWENCDRALHWMQSLFTVQSQFGITIYRCNPVIE